MSSERTELHCPRCGATEVWVETSEGDYEVGPSFVCTACRGAFTMQALEPNRESERQIRAILGEPELPPVERAVISPADAERFLLTIEAPRLIQPDEAERLIAYIKAGQPEPLGGWPTGEMP